jgi:hypothetical protein
MWEAFGKRITVLGLAMTEIATNKLQSRGDKKEITYFIAPVPYRQTTEGRWAARGARQLE